MALQLAAIHYDNRRYDLAASEAQRALASDPRDARAHAVLALALLQLKHLKEATSEAEAAISLAPDLPIAHSARAEIMMRRNRFSDARASATEAIRLEPEETQNYATLANVEIASRQWKKAYEVSGQGLAIDADHPGLLRIRSLAAAHLGRADEAQSTSRAALQVNPDESRSLAVHGYQLMQAGRFQEARGDFTASLRLDAHNKLARAGLLQTIKATNVFYRWMLRYLLLMARLSNRQRLVILVSVPFIVRLAASGMMSIPAASWLVLPLIVIWVTFVLSSWLASPLSNLFLMLHPLGRYVLNDEERDQAWLVGALLGLALIGVGLFVAGIAAGLFLAGSGLAAAIPTSTTFHAQPGWPRWILGAFATAAVVTGSIATAAAFAQADPTGSASQAWSPFALCLGTAILSMWAAQYLVRVQPTR